MNLFIVDAETNGLYGDVLSIGAIVLDKELKETISFYGEVKIVINQSYEPWVKENVLPHMRDPDPFENEIELLNAFWKFWMANRQDTYCLADVAYPVEMGVFKKCVEINKTERSFLGPFPFLDLSSFLMAKGYDPLVKRLSLVDSKAFNQHHALDDVRIAAEIWRKLNE